MTKKEPGDDQKQKQSITHIIEVATTRQDADLCITGAHILDVYNKEWFSADLLIADGLICGYAKSGEGRAKEVFDAKGKYLAPGFIDAHVHIESSHSTPEEFSNLVVPCGTTTVVADPHELCNVTGLAGLDYMLAATEHTALQAFFMVPSCVPSTEFENSGAILHAPEIAKRIALPRVLGLGEMMDYPGVIAGKALVVDKIWEARKIGKIIDGHSPALSDSDLDAYASTGIKTDHECESAEELHSRVRRGMYVMLREGSACKNVLGLLGGVTQANSRRCLFCTDDRQPKSILEDGHINNNVRIAVADGLDAIEAICMATVNSSECYNLKDRGAIAPGLRADLVLCNDLKDFSMHRVYIGGELVAQDGKILNPASAHHDPLVAGRMDVKDFSASRLALPLKSAKVRIIDAIPGGVVTGAGEAEVTIVDGAWVHDPSVDIIKLAVIERHKGTGNVGVALIRGFGLKGGAIVSSVGHDSHNIVVAGDNDQDMVVAVEYLIGIGGGMALIKDGKVLASLPMPIGGLMSDRPGSEVAKALDILDEVGQKKFSINADMDAFTTLSFMALPVIPAYKLTDKGLFDVRSFSFVPMEI
ncbi:MAG: adenine deaminase [Spirochaetia bacterium]|nr:adenine deaminase [Spirochaetia bacterium]